MTIDAGRLTEILRGHYLPPNRPAGGLFAAEVGSPCGRRRADAIWLPLTRAGGTGLVGHELKVSRSDVLAELADPTKAEPWSQFCDHWWLVVSDPTLVDGLEIPEAWGIMSPPSGRRTRSMTIIRKAPKLQPLEPAQGVRRLLAWHFYGTQERLGTVERGKRFLEGEVERLRREVAEARAGAVGSPHAKRVAGIIHEAENRKRDLGVWASLDDEAVIDAIVDAEATRQAARHVRQSLERHMHAVDDALEPIRFGRDQIEKAIKAGVDGIDEATGGRAS